MPVLGSPWPHGRACALVLALSACGQAPVRVPERPDDDAVTPTDDDRDPSCWQPGSGYALREVVARFGPAARLEVEVFDACPDNQLARHLEVRGADGTLLGVATPSAAGRNELALTQPVSANEALELRLFEEYADPPAGADVGAPHVSSVSASEPRLDEVYRLRESAHSGTTGCHGQAIKFDGTYFYSACQDLDWADEARAFIHDSLGNKVCEFSLGTDYGHPGGISLSGRGVYVGFSRTDLSGGAAILAHLSAEPCALELLNDGAELEGSICSIAPLPIDVCAEAPQYDALLVYGSFGRTYRLCEVATGLCGETVDNEDGGLIISTTEAPQDCDLYFDAGWQRVCVAVSNPDNRVHVFAADTVDTDESSWRETGRLELGGRPHSGGVGFYTSAAGERYVVIAPTDESGSCDVRAPCTSAAREQLVQFLPFSAYDWPAGECR